MESVLDTQEQAILRSWHVNAEPWAAAIREARIASRRLVTNQAIVDAVCGVGARRVLDVGCGEGWLARALAAEGIGVFGVDAVPSLIAEARRLGGAEFHVRAYEDLVRGELSGGPVEAAVCNFSLLGKESVETLLGALGRHLTGPRHLIVQTLHPLVACGERPYVDGWREGSWAGFGAEFSDPAPWYFRTLQSWIAMLRRCGYEILECREPTAVDAAAPASALFICRECRGGTPIR